MEKYFHELTKAETDKLIEEKKDWHFVMNNYKQPEWCGYPNALEGRLGCWSLVDIDGTRLKISKEFCNGCDCFIHTNC